jgi:hypothetical protein
LCRQAVERRRLVLFEPWAVSTQRVGPGGSGAWPDGQRADAETDREELRDVDFKTPHSTTVSPSP